MIKLFKYLSLLLVIFIPNLFSQNMNDNASRSLFSDHKASQIGDMVTVLIVEQSSAQNAATTQAVRDSKISLSGGANLTGHPALTGNVGANGGTGNNFTGSGTTSNKGDITAKISAKITQIDDNGNLVIEGKRKIKVNDEEQVIEIKGVIRLQDILPDNSIYSYKISDAEISVKGDGIVNSAQSPGLLTKIFRWLF